MFFLNGTNDLNLLTGAAGARGAAAVGTGARTRGSCSRRPWTRGSWSGAWARVFLEQQVQQVAGGGHGIVVGLISFTLMGKTLMLIFFLSLLWAIATFLGQTSYPEHLHSHFPWRCHLSSSDWWNFAPWLPHPAPKAMPAEMLLVPWRPLTGCSATLPAEASWEGRSIGIGRGVTPRLRDQLASECKTVACCCETGHMCLVWAWGWKL